MGWEISQVFVTFYRELSWFSVKGQWCPGRENRPFLTYYACEEVAFPSGHGP